MRSPTAACGLVVLLALPAWADGVRAWEEPLTIPTYLSGSPDPDPMFYTGESYQGAQKRVYPYPLQDRLTHVREDRTYRALHLENQYIRLTVLPELGGRLFAATDKTNGYDFFYRQQVIKPALIGMLGAWISGGVEWCAFHHHRNTTFMPVDGTLEESRDGSRTIWIGETERRHRMRWLIGLTLRPGRSYLEATVKFFNRTPQPHSILYWANVAVHVNDDYQVLFPPSVQVATYHSKIDFTFWPVSQGRYRGSDYSGLDISWWKSSAEQNSFFAWDLREDFMGGYDHGRRAGVVHVGDHHRVCGAKLWEWGTGPAGRAWDKILTDADGPYAELMVGAWSDNQPDYSWIKPYETKVITQYWYPVREIGGFKNANLDAAVNLELSPGGRALFGFHATSRLSNARATLTAGGKILSEEIVDVAPDRPFAREVAVPAGTRSDQLRAALIAQDGRELIAYQPVERAPAGKLPQAVKPPPRPEELKTVEELYLTGLRVEQIHSPSVDPSVYYREALKRDPGDTRSNTMLGIHCNKRGLYAEAERHLRIAVERLSAEYTRLRDTEAQYQLGLALRAQGKLDEARDSFYRASWDSAMHAPAFCQLAELSCMQGDFGSALEQIEQAISTSALNTRARGIKAMVLRRLGRISEAESVAAGVGVDDPLDFLGRNELCLAARADGRRDTERDRLARLAGLMRGDVQSYLELATDYMNCGAWDEAIEVLRRPVEAGVPFAGTYPLVHYYLGYLQELKRDTRASREHFAEAARMPSDYCFPFRLETVDVLNAAIRADPSDAHAFYYLGNLLFELQPERAIACWEKSRELDATMALVHRNLGWAAYRVRRDVPSAIACYEQAVACNALDPRLFLELDTLYELGNADPERRLAMLERHHPTVAQRQDALLREIMVLVLAGRHERAIEYLARNRFHAREGAEGIRDVYADAHLLRGLELMKAGRAADAVDHFQQASEYPENLAVGRPRNDRRAAQADFCLGSAREVAGEAEKARQHYTQGARRRVPQDATDARYYQALCLKKTGQPEEAGRVFRELVDAGTRRLAETEDTDFFAKFGERETKGARLASAHFAIGLGLLGQGETERAVREFEDAVQLNLSHVWARYHAKSVRADQAPGRP